MRGKAWAGPVLLRGWSSARVRGRTKGCKTIQQLLVPGFEVFPGSLRHSRDGFKRI